MRDSKRLATSPTKHADLVTPDLDTEIRKLRQANAEARTLLTDAVKRLRAVLEEDPVMAETPLEASTVMQCAVEAIGAALRQLEWADPTTRPSATPPLNRPNGPNGPNSPNSPNAPTRQQGQFLAFIRAYTMQNFAGVAPRHADLQRFFNLTAPSVNSMLIRLEQRGFIRRVPGRARAIEIIIEPSFIPPLERPFKF